MEVAVGARIRAERQLRGLSLRQLASKVGVSASMLSQVEIGRTRASVSTLYRLVTELGLSLDDLFEIGPSSESAPQSAVPVIVENPNVGNRKIAESRQYDPVLSAENRVRIELESGVVWERLSNLGPDGVEFILATYRPGSRSALLGKYQQHDGFEYAYVVCGELTLKHRFDTWVLHAGDALGFDSSDPHMLENRGTEDAKAAWFILRGGAAARRHELSEAAVDTPHRVLRGAVHD